MSGATSPDSESTVLLVDDDPAILRTYERILRKKGYEVVTAQGGDAAVQALMSRRFGVVVSDIRMPGMSGIDLLQVVRARDLDVPVVLMTGMPSVESAIEAVRYGAMQYLPKPIGNDHFVETIARALRLHQMARAKREALELQDQAAERPGDRAGLEGAFGRALEGMWMAFQPIVDHTQRSVFAYEALMRSREPSLPHPGAVLDAAERLHRMPELGRRTRALSHEAFSQAPGGPLLFINLHATDLLDSSLYDQDSPLASIASRVVLEITERASLDGIDDIKHRMSELRRLGYRIAVDDLGAGYAGLTSFVALEPEFVKLDMSLVRGMHESTTRQRVIGTMISLCSELQMRVIAEGVEVAEERDGLSRLGCSLLQGYFFAKPGPPFPTVTFT